MPFPNGSPSTRDQVFLDRIATNSDILADASSVANGWMTQELFSATVLTNTTITGTTLNVKAASSHTIMVDVTGQLVSGTAAATGATGLVLTLRGGLSGFGFVTLRAFTAGLGTFAWKVASAGVVTGATAETTGISRFDDLFLQCASPATSTGGSLVIKARVFSSPEF